jgi:hypothetical protein
LSADLTLRQLEQQRGEWLAHRVQVSLAKQLMAVADQHAGEAVEQTIGAFLVELQVARGMEGNA